MGREPYHRSLRSILPASTERPATSPGSRIPRYARFREDLFEVTYHLLRKHKRPTDIREDTGRPEVRAVSDDAAGADQSINPACRIDVSWRMAPSSPCSAAA
jgi:hypothetical protein